MTDTPAFGSDICVGSEGSESPLIPEPARPIHEYPTRNWLYEYKDSERPSLPDKIGPYSLSHDERGAVVSVDRVDNTDAPSGAIYRWDDAGRLAYSASQRGPSVQGNYHYDAFGRRIRKELFDGEGQKKAFLYPSEYYVAQLQRIVQLDCSHIEKEACESDLEFRTKSIRLNGRSIALVNRIVDPASDQNGDKTLDFVNGAGQVHFLHTDQVNSNTVVANENGDSFKYYEYLPFGEIVPPIER